MRAGCQVRPESETKASDSNRRATQPLTSLSELAPAYEIVAVPGLLRTHHQLEKLLGLEEPSQSLFHLGQWCGGSGVKLELPRGLVKEHAPAVDASASCAICDFD